MADPRLVRSLLAAIAADPALLSAVRAERNSLAGKIALDPAYGREVVNGSGQGMTFTATTTMSAQQRLGFLQQALDCYDNGVTPSSWAPIAFR